MPGAPGIMVGRGKYLTTNPDFACSSVKCQNLYLMALLLDR